jgi:hypothetical protein
MKTTMKKAVIRGWRRTEAGVHAGVLLAAVLLSASGCGPVEDGAEPLALARQRQELITLNGLSSNGLSSNGLSFNGLSSNGLSSNGLSTPQFTTWFDQDPAVADMVMRYVIRCAVPAEQTRSYPHEQTGQTYTWSGGLGLAPAWASGLPPSTAEQQVITACLLAHVNRYGLSVPISVMGRDAQRNIIPYSLSEALSYSISEACFFGNLFTQEGLFFGVDRVLNDEAHYLTRACAALSSPDEDSAPGSAESCAPLHFIGSCWQHCTPDLLALSYWSCTYNGVSYQPLVTRMQPSDYLQLFPDSEAGEDGT